MERATAWHYRISHNWTWFKVVSFVLLSGRERFQEVHHSEPIRPSYEVRNFRISEVGEGKEKLARIDNARVKWM